MFDYLGNRFKKIRTEVYNVSQNQFAEDINNFILKHNKDQFKELSFNQNIISNFEKDTIIKQTKLIYLFNYLYMTKRINPLWFIEKINKDVPLYLTKIEIDKSINDKYISVNKHLNDMSKEIKGIFNIIENKYS